MLLYLYPAIPGADNHRSFGEKEKFHLYRTAGGARPDTCEQPAPQWSPRDRELAAGPNLIFSVLLVLVNAGYFAASCIPRWASPGRRWYTVSKIVAGAGLAGWGHPLLFAIISYCGYAISAACLGMAAARAARYLSRLQHARQGPGQQPGRAMN